MGLFRKIFLAAAAALTVLFAAVPASAAEASSVSAQAAVLYDPLSGAVLYEKNGGGSAADGEHDENHDGAAGL